jgi:hypothetical protein
MAIVEFTLEGRGYVILPMREYKRLLTLAENAHDVRKAKAVVKHYRKTGRGVSLQALKRELES